ncbi:MAG: RIP metalloprotease RseP [Firmicutes bacterium]|nr:RIP metalloprotease RseP [Bacillota bacterium]
MKTAILAILLFCIMIFPHELGHFIAARRVGVKVNEFAFGMGPAIWKKQGPETLYSIRLFPVGGFCAMEGEDEDSNEPRAFGNKKPWQKIVVLAAGSFMNIICAIVIMSLVIGIMGFTTTVVGQVTEDLPAKAAGILEGDKLLKIDDTEIEQWTDVSKALQASGGEEVVVTLERDKQVETVSVVPQLTEGVDAQGNPAQGYVLGVTCKISHNPFMAVVDGAQSTWNMTKMMFSALGQLFTGEAGVDELSGPVGMINMVSQTTEYGFWYYGFLTALICVNLAIINLLPLPALDGGRIIFVIYTMITGKTVSEKVEGAIHMVGMVLLLALMVFVTMNDITRIFG